MNEPIPIITFIGVFMSFPATFSPLFFQPCLLTIASNKGLKLAGKSIKNPIKLIVGIGSCSEQVTIVKK